MTIANNVVLYDNVTIGADCEIGPFCEIGVPPRGKREGELTTHIGAGSILRSQSVIYAGSQIGEEFQSGHGILIRENNQVGARVSIGSHSVIEHSVTIGNNVRIHSQAFIPEHSVLEDGCWIGPNVVLTNSSHPLCPHSKECLRGPRIESGAKIGANVTLLPGVVIGEMALVGAGSVVTEDVSSGDVVVGNPARVVNKVSDLTCPYGVHEGPYGDLYAVYEDKE